MYRYERILVALAVSLVILTSGAESQLTQSNYDNAISAMMSAASRSARVGQMRNVPSVTVVRLKQIVVFRHPGDEPDLPSIQISAQKNAFGIRRLRNALAANPATRAALARKGVPLNRIVGADVFSNGALLVYIL
jgi:hypothetical protein